MRSPIFAQSVYPYRLFTWPVEHSPFRQSACAYIHIIALGRHPHA